jgi:hypothetical protein
VDGNALGTFSIGLASSVTTAEFSTSLRSSVSVSLAVGAVPIDLCSTAWTSVTGVVVSMGLCSSIFAC